MATQNKIQLFEEKKVRTVWDSEQEKWFFSVVDVIEVLTDSPRPRKYWNALKTKLENEGSEFSHSLGQLKIRELVLNMLAELSTKDISEATNPETLHEHAEVAHQGGQIARNARLELEQKTGQKVVTSLNANKIKSIKNKKNDD